MRSSAARECPTRSRTDLARLDGETLHVVSGDNRFLRACTSPLVGHQKLGDFKVCDDVKEALWRLAVDAGRDIQGDRADRWLEKFRDCVQSEHGTVERYVSDELLRQSRASYHRLPRGDVREVPARDRRALKRR
jgi:hypothetical protein